MTTDKFTIREADAREREAGYVKVAIADDGPWAYLTRDGKVLCLDAWPLQTLAALCRAFSS